MKRPVECEIKNMIDYSVYSIFKLEFHCYIVFTVGLY